MWDRYMFATVDNVETQVTEPSLTSVLAGQPVGMWVVLDPDMKTVLGSAETPEEALRQAGVGKSEPTAFDRGIGERPVMVQVPDPSLMCFY
jgi:hypothetical protein